jgi:hypothetical protein
MSFPFDYKLAALIFIVIAMYYTVFISPYLFKKTLITKELQEIIDYACEQGVGYAEQLFKFDPSIDRTEIALYFAFYVLRKTNAVPNSYLEKISEIIEDKVGQLLKNEKSNGNVTM